MLEAGLRLLGRDGPAALTARALASEANTSPAAIYELFGNKGGVVRALFFSGFGQLAAELAGLEQSDDPLRDLHVLASGYRRFILAHPALAAVMFSRPFSTFEPTADESAAGAAVRKLIVAAVRRAVAARQLRGDPVDIAHAYVALIQGLAAAESSSRLGTSKRSVERRWDTALGALLAGFAADG